MSRKRFTAEQIIHKLRQAEVELANGVFPHWIAVRIARTKRAPAGNFTLNGRRKTQTNA
ncbi:MAG TPA: hypothetical protein QF870_04025 [Nitrospinota bacterium]|jgi:hypothetical protein|nr:hypothetical protein [Nitrospinota bacterium]HJM42471.1 hypothetical protein [Nitrospinota bacterium]